MAPDEGQLLEIGRIVKAHGIRGEVVVEAITNRPERFDAGSTLIGRGRRFSVVRAQRHKPAEAAGRATRTRWIVAFEGVATRNEAEALRGEALFGEPLEGGADDGDELWVHELIGSEVVDLSGAILGRVQAVEENPASDLLVLDGGGLVPLVFVVGHGDGRVTVDPPAGLLDL